MANQPIANQPMANQPMATNQWQPTNGNQVTGLKPQGFSTCMLEKLKTPSDLTSGLFRHPKGIASDFEEQHIRP